MSSSKTTKPPSMTASLACFLGKLLQEAKNNCGDSLSEFVIVDDNAQLSPENRIKNAVSFASNVSSAGSSSCHLNSRWSSQPSLVTSMMKQSFNLESPSRWNCSIEPCADDPTTQKINASWNVAHDIGMDNASTTWSNNKLNDIIERAPKNHILPSNPLMSMNCPKRRPSSDESSMDVPPLLQGSTSPRPFQSRFLEKRNHSDRLAQTSLRSALGGMAPKPSSFTERKRGVGKKDYAAPATRMPTTTSSSSKKKKKAVGSPPKGIRKSESCSEPRTNQSL